MMRLTRLMAIGGLAGGIVIGGTGVSAAATPAAPLKGWTHGDLNTAQLTDVKSKKRYKKGKRWGKYGLGPRYYSRRHVYRPYAYRHGYKHRYWGGPRLSLRIGPRHRHWW